MYLSLKYTEIMLRLEESYTFSVAVLFSVTPVTLITTDPCISLTAISLYISGKNNFSHNTGSPNTFTGFQGGAITAFQSNINIHGECTLMYNHAKNGGAMHAAESKVWMYNKMEIANNTVDESGGGIHLYQTDLNCHYYCKLKLVNNVAIKNGGGIRAVGSSIKVHQGTYCKQNNTDCALPSA